MPIFFEGRCDTAREVSRDEAVEMWNSSELRDRWFAKTRDRTRHCWAKVCVVQIPGVLVAYPVD